MKGRKVLWVLGAGASKGAGAYATVQHGGRIAIPTQSDFWPVILRFCKSSTERKKIESFLFRYFTDYGSVPARLKPMDRGKILRNVEVEEVFTFLSERIQSPSTSHSLRTYFQQIWPLMVQQVGVTFGRFNANSSTREIYKSLTKAMRSRDAVISFNYDTIFENSLPAKYKWYYGGIKDSAGIAVYKPHGSVNWVNQGDEIIPRVSSVSQPVIVAPTHLKFVVDGAKQPTDSQSEAIGYLTQSKQISKIWSEMEKELTKARTIVFVGYSFPVADLYFSSVLRTMLATRSSMPRIVLVNPDSVEIERRIRSRFSLNYVGKHFDLKSFSKLTRDSIEA